MNVRPLIVRELRAEARRPSAYWVRTLAGALLTALFVWSAWNFGEDANSLGPFLFATLSEGFLIGTLAIVTALASDSISREKREGTLGLLFLTPLNANDIVIGKTLLQVFKAVPILIAMLPIVSLPFLLGGIGIEQIASFLLGIVVMIALAVGSGIIASVNTREWIQATTWGLLIGAACLFAMFLFERLIIGIVFQRRSFASHVTEVLATATTLFVAAYLKFALRHAGKRLRQTWQQEAAETRDPLWVRFFSQSDFWRSAFRWDTRKARDRNPIAWLQEYNWTSRLTKWGWCVLLFAAQMRMLLQFRRYIDYQMDLYMLTAAGIAFSAAASFRRERQTGALELLLVTPISAAQLIWGRLQGVWFHFLPAMAIQACVWIMGPQWISLPYRYWYYLAGAYLCIPVIGFYSALITSNVLISWLLTLFFSMLLPYALTETFRFDIGRRNLPIAFFSLQSALALTAAFLLFENLTKRRFVSH